MQRLDQRAARRPGDCSAGFRTTALPAASAAGGHPGGDREREVPGRDHRRHPAREVAHPVALAGGVDAARGPARARPRGGRSRSGSRSPRRRRRRPRPRASRTRARRAPPARAGARAGARRRGRAPRPARPPAAPRPLRGAPRTAASTAAAASDRPARPALATSRSGAPGSVESIPSAGPALAADQDRHAERQGCVQLAQRRQQRLALVRPAQLQLGLVAERACDRSRRLPAAPRPARRRACSPRNDSFAVFSSRRRTR